MNNRKPELKSLLEHEEVLTRLLSEARGQKISIYADMLFNMDPYDFIDFMTGSMAVVFTALAAMVGSTPPESNLFPDICMDPSVIAKDALTFATVAAVFGSLHGLYRYYQERNSYALDYANHSIDHYSKEKAKAARKREALFPETKSYLSLATDAVHKVFGM